MKPYCLVLLLVIAACSSPSPSETEKQSDSTTVTVAPPPPAKVELGERLTLEGDFDGDGTKEKLIEHYVSRETGKELSKIYPDMEYDTLVEVVFATHPKLYLSSSNAAIKDLPVSDIDQLFGFLQLKNEGDLNGDGTDEVSYIVNFADWSNLNRFHIVSFRNGQWQELVNFEIREWQLEDEKPLFAKNTDGTLTVKTFDEEANEVEKTIPIKK